MRFCYNGIFLLSGLITLSVAGAQNDLCPTANGDFPDVAGCVTFLRCVGGIAFRMKCTRGTAFDTNFGRCISQRQVVCTRNAQVNGPLVSKMYLCHTKS